MKDDHLRNIAPGDSLPPATPSGGRARWAFRPSLLRTRFFLGVLIGLLVCLFGLLVLATNYEVVDKRPVCATCEDLLYRIRLFDSFTFSVKPDYKPTPDAVSGYFLVSISSMALLALVFLYVVATKVPSRVRWFFLATWLGALYLGADELFGIHESLGYNMEFLGDIPGVDRPDDVVFASYIFPALAYVFFFWRFLFSSRPVLALYGLAIGLFVLGSLGDVLSLGPVEDLIEILSSICIVVAFMLVAIERMTAAQTTAADEISGGAPSSTPALAVPEARGGTGSYSPGAAAR